jgi:hypothetical protein
MKIIITERQNNLLNENIPLGIRRRYDPDSMKSHLEVIIEDIEPCDYGSVLDFISEMCDILVGDILYDYEDYHGGTVSSKIKDDFYYFVVDNFANYLKEIYDKNKCK